MAAVTMATTNINKLIFISRQRHRRQTSFEKLMQVYFFLKNLHQQILLTIERLTFK
jgi:abortive infection bacteriophage resistance protein